MGKSYEKLGADLVVEARQAYERVVREYADHPAIVAEAEKRLAVLVVALDAVDATDTPKALTVRKLFDGELNGPPSPDGRYFSTTLWRKANPEVYDGNLGVYALKTGEYRAITSEATMAWPIEFAYDGLSIWSPDGKQIAYVWNKVDDENATSELRIVNVDGGEPLILHVSSEIAGVHPQSWTSDGKYILAVKSEFANNRQTDRIVLMNVKTGTSKVIKVLADGIHTMEMSLSPDGKYITYETFTLENKTLRDLHIVSTDGRFDQVLIEHPADDHRPYWTPDGSGVIFESNRSGRAGLWYVAIIAGETTGEPRFVHAAAIKNGYGFTNDGTYYYSEERSDINIFLAGIDVDSGMLQTQPEVLSKRFEAVNTSPSWSPDGSKLAYFSVRGSGNRVLIIRDAQSGEERDLRPHGLEIGRMPPQWSPDGKTILVNGRSLGSSNVRLYLVDIKTDRVKHLAKIDNHKGILTPDGISVVHLRKFQDGADWYNELVEENIESGEVRVLEHNILYPSHLTISPDGSQLAYFDPNLVVLSLRDGSRRILIPSTPDRNLIRRAIYWTRDAAHLLTVLPHEDDGQPHMYLVDASNGEVKSAGSPIPIGDPLNTLIPQVSVHPNGTEIAFSSGTSLSQMWAIDNLVFEK